MVGIVPELRSFGAMRELQHFHDVSQEPKSPGVPLLRVRGADAKELPEVRFQICLFFWRGFRASGRTAAQRISHCAHRTPGPRHDTHQAAISGDLRSVCRWSAGYFSGDTDAGEGARFSARDVGGRDFRRWITEHA